MYSINYVKKYMNEVSEVPSFALFSNTRIQLIRATCCPLLTLLSNLAKFIQDNLHSSEIYSRAIR